MKGMQEATTPAPAATAITVPRKSLRETSVISLEFSSGMVTLLNMFNRDAK
jgi:hypothetical protein